MRADGKTDQEIISNLGLKEEAQWIKDQEYLKPLFGFITSTHSKEDIKPLISQAQQEERIKNRANW
jgi:hypothetical protein